MINKITEHIYIGEFSDVIGETQEESIQNLKFISSLGITHVISLCSSLEHRKPEHDFFQSEKGRALCIFFHETPVPVFYTGMNAFKIGLEASYHCLKRILFAEPDAKVLVHCTSGIDRAPFVVATYMTQTEETGLGEAYGEIKKARPSICEHYEWRLFKE